MCRNPNPAILHFAKKHTPIFWGCVLQYLFISFITFYTQRLYLVALYALLGSFLFFIRVVCNDLVNLFFGFISSSRNNSNRNITSI